MDHPDCSYRKNTVKIYRRCCSALNQKRMPESKRIPWSQEEIIFLLETRGCPNFYQNWRQHASKSGWPPRGKASLLSKLKYLEGKKIERKTEYLSQYQLAQKLGVSESTIAKWRSEGGLPYKKIGDPNNTRTPCKTKISDFVKWATSEGKQEVAKALTGDRLAATWFLSRLGELIEKGALYDNQLD
jgi:transcriptional regulator with XRE-family HTH domain